MTLHVVHDVWKHKLVVHDGEKRKLCCAAIVYSIAPRPPPAAFFFSSLAPLSALPLCSLSSYASAFCVAVPAAPAPPFLCSSLRLSSLLLLASSPASASLPAVLNMLALRNEAQLIIKVQIIRFSQGNPLISNLSYSPRQRPYPPPHHPLNHKII